MNRIRSPCAALRFERTDSLMLLPDKFNAVRVVFVLSTVANDSAPGRPMSLLNKFKSVRVMFVLSDLSVASR